MMLLPSVRRRRGKQYELVIHGQRGSLGSEFVSSARLTVHAMAKQNHKVQMLFTSLLENVLEKTPQTLLCLFILSITKQKHQGKT